MTEHPDWMSMSEFLETLHESWMESCYDSNLSYQPEDLWRDLLALGPEVVGRDD